MNSMRALAAIVVVGLDFSGRTMADSIPSTTAPARVVADIFPVPQSLDPTNIRSASHYIILAHLVRTLISLDARAQIEANLAESWTHSADYAEYKFKLRKDAKWSDGTPIVAENVVRTIRHQMSAGTAIHADFEDIESVSAPAPDNLNIRLKRSNANFLLKLAHPEFGVIKNPDAETDLARFGCSSGPYVLTSAGPHFVLKRNLHYPGFAAGAPDEVEFQSSPAKEQLDNMRTSKADFVIPHGEVTPAEHKAMTALPGISPWTPHIGFTYWLNLNPNSPGTSSREVRTWLQSVLRPGRIDTSGLAPFWTPATQLYLPDGIGRLTAPELDAFWKGSENAPRPREVPKTLSVLLYSRYPYADKVLAALRAEGLTLDVTEYKSQDEYSRQTNAKVFDLVMVNNDFSSADVLENLLVSFNPVRPLVYVPNGDRTFRSLLDRAENEFDQAGRHRLFREIGERILKEGLICPLSYMRVIGYRRSTLDVSNWSAVYPDVSFWRARIQSTK